jgi:hypothetical protein
MGASEWLASTATTVPGLVESDIDLLYPILRHMYGFDEIRYCINWQFTKRNVLTHLKWIREVTGPGDIAFISISTHGGQIAAEAQPSWAPLETDFLDEFFVTVEPEDLMYADPLRDRDIGGIIREINPEAVTFVLIDSCHSGTGLRSFYEKSISNLRIPLTIVTPPEYLPTDFNMEEHWMDILSGNIEKKGSGWKTIVPAAEQGEAILLSATDASTVAWGGYICGRFRGFLTFFFSQILLDYSGNITYREIHDELQIRLASYSISQNPQLEGKDSRFDSIFLK